MKKLIYILFLIVGIACDSEDAGDCFQKTGDIIQQEVTVASFTKLLVNRDVELVIKQDATQSVIIETGKNLLNDVTAEVVDGRLTLTDNNTCNYVREYGVTKVYVTAPNITEIRSSTQFDIRSDGVLTYPELTILSEDFGAPGSFNVGDFRLQIDNTSFRVVFNNLSVAYITGQTENLSVTFASGTSRFEGRNLVAQTVSVNNRGSNDMIVNPQQEITGTISGIGDVISVNTPPIINVEEVYRGRLILE
ncbi:head GIN domain-containing protein [Algibacter pectinivorans]|uniref:Putative auto-transporter adhesin, head GIN domain n=1 Tax=Algibacter pectinivorans TaxID=870482 RepID=A0A1I1PVL1_9FLAO|nr:head GIN domain-containing protein [Algibacter pectinivorans]SFD11618.1 Putative auto-transporter adhesin, head GIN domain [Algibacter pectinivorans]